MGDLHAFKPLEFDYRCASSTEKLFRSEAEHLDGQASLRSEAAQSAERDFKGLYADQFKANMQVAQGDLADLTDALNAIATGIGRLIKAAHEEDHRRLVAREYMERHANIFEKCWDNLFGQAPVPPHDS